MLERQQRIERPLDQVFPFYGDAANLERITPPWLGFEVTTPKSIEMGVGALVDYRLRLHGVPVRWRTRIEEWRPPHHFVDAQLSGPYSLWHHTHTFEADGENATILGDRVRYAIRFGPAGEFARALFVGRDVSGSSTTAAMRWRSCWARAARQPRRVPSPSSRALCPPAFLHDGGVGRRGRCSRSASRSG